MRLLFYRIMRCYQVQKILYFKNWPDRMNLFLWYPLALVARCDNYPVKGPSEPDLLDLCAGQDGQPMILPPSIAFDHCKNFYFLDKRHLPSHNILWLVYCTWKIAKKHAVTQNSLKGISCRAQTAKIVPIICYQILTPSSFISPKLTNARNWSLYTFHNQTYKLFSAHPKYVLKYFATWVGHECSIYWIEYTVYCL